ncbi:MAG: thiamine pyrophosphate-dependent enzyme [Candidatus Magasanikbacteria bacterium]|nr:thiamine pyrophosphate-dependent enzyme [Candidatus Magasanikbacteria bacterium]
MNQENAAKFCAGCGYSVILMILNQVLAAQNVQDKAVMGLDIGCSLLGWNYLPINTFQTHHGRVVPTMLGYKRARKESTSVAVVGDGGAYAIGWQSLFYAARRDEPITVIVVNNSVYAMTGGQTAPTTVCGQKTDTHPAGSCEESFYGPEILKTIVKPGAYLARSAANDPKGIFAALEKAVQTQQAGHFSLVEILSFCPTNWKTTGKATFDYLENLKKIYKIGEV